MTRYSVGAMQSTFTRSRVEHLQALGGIEARVVQQRRRAADPRRDEDVARRLAPAARRRAPDEVAGARREPVLGLQRLAGEVALAVDDRLRLARGPARERDQARIQRREVGRRRHAPRRARAAAHPGAGSARRPPRPPADRARGRAPAGRARSARPSPPRRAPPRCARGTRRAPAGTRRAAAAGPSRAAARCTAARRSPGESTRPSRRPNRACCRQA